MGLLDGPVDRQVDRIVHSHATAAHFRNLLDYWHGLAQEKLPPLPGGQIMLNMLDSLYVGNEDELAAHCEESVLSLWDAKDKAMADPQRQMDRLRRKTALGLWRTMPGTTFAQRLNKVGEASDQQLVDAIRGVHQQVKGVAMAGPVVGGFGDWAHEHMPFIADHWLQILQAFCAILGLLLILAPVPEAE